MNYKAEEYTIAHLYWGFNYIILQ